jgi:hypothetical protein
MLLTLVRDSGSQPPPGASGAIASDDESPRLPFAGDAKSFTIEVPYTPQGAGVLAQVLLSWRLAKAGRAVFLMLPDEPELEIGQLSPSRIEWMLPVVTQIAVIESYPASAAPTAED